MNPVLLLSVASTAVVLTAIAALFLRTIQEHSLVTGWWSAFDNYLLAQEQFGAGNLVPLTIATVLMAAAATYVWPRWLVDSLAPYYAQLSRDPFNPLSITGSLIAS